MVTGNGMKGAEGVLGTQSSVLQRPSSDSERTSPLDGLDPAADYDYSSFHDDEGHTLAPAPAKPFFRSASIHDAGVPCVDVLAALELVRAAHKLT